MSTLKCNHSSGYASPTAKVRAGALLMLKVGVVLALGGCAATVPARVTTFQQWPADAVGSSWKLATSNEQRDSLEYRQYADMVRSAMGPVGLVEAKPGQAARFAVALDYGTEPVKIQVERSYDPFYSPWGPYGYGGFGRRGRAGIGFGYGFGAPYPPTWSTTTIDASRSYLKVEIRDTSRGDAKVYESTAVNTGSGGSMPEVMPYLVRAIFDRFPDTNGQVRTINYEVESRR